MNDKNINTYNGNSENKNEFVDCLLVKFLRGRCKKCFPGGVGRRKKFKIRDDDAVTNMNS